MITYQKIETVFERDPQTKKLIVGKWRNPTVQWLADKEWWITEKIDGTNIRVHWDGYDFTFAGRTNNAEIQKPLLENDNTCPNFREVIIGVDDAGINRSYRYCDLKHYYDFVAIHEMPDKYGCQGKEE